MPIDRPVSRANRLLQFVPSYSIPHREAEADARRTEPNAGRDAWQRPSKIAIQVAVFRQQSIATRAFKRESKVGSSA